jgi:hypothetical protein
VTIDELVKLFPERAFALYRVERGCQNNRRFVWKATWNAGYYTSDSDRHMTHENSRSDYFGDTPEEALEKLARSEVENARASVLAFEKELEDLREKRASAERRLAGLKP